MALTLAIVACTQPSAQPPTPAASAPASQRSSPAPRVSEPAAATSPPRASAGAVSGGPTAASPAASTSTGQTNPPGSGGLALWQELADFPVSQAFEVTSVTAAPPTGFVAVGFGAMPGEGYFGRHQGIVWRSVDGRAWTVEIDPAFQFVTLQEVAALADSIFVFGTIATCDALFSEECVEPPDAGWTVWRSTAGGPWERLPQVPQMQFGSVDGVTATDTTLVAFGSTGDEGRAAVWTSPDGAAWTATTSLGELIQATAALGVGAAVVLFGYSEAGPNLELVAAAAADGSRFAPVEAPRLADTTVRAIARGADGGLVAVGETNDLDLRLTAIALQSTDSGATWSQSDATDGSFADAAAAWVHPTASGYVALGSSPIPDEFGLANGHSWLSHDGTNWQALAPVGGTFTDLSASARGASGIVAFTVRSEEPDEITVTSTVGAWLLPQ